MGLDCEKSKPNCNYSTRASKLDESSATWSNSEDYGWGLDGGEKCVYKVCLYVLGLMFDLLEWNENIHVHWD